MIDNSGTRHARSCLIAARERPRAGSKQMATYHAVAQTQSSWSSSCQRTSPRCGRKLMATYQAVAQTQSNCRIAARERPRAGSKRMATYQAVVAQTQSSSRSSNLVCSRRSLARSYTLSTTVCIINELLLCGAHLHSVDPILRCCCCCTYFLAHAAAACLLHLSLSLYFLFFPPAFSPPLFKNKLAKLKGLLRVQPRGRRKDEPQRRFISERYYEV